jgi:hypothetical protein
MVRQNKTIEANIKDWIAGIYATNSSLFPISNMLDICSSTNLGLLHYRKKGTHVPFED